MGDSYWVAFYRFLQQRGDIKEEAQCEHFARYLKEFEAGEKVLDVGCGRGEFLELLRAKGCTGIGLDADPGMVAVCKGKGLTVVQEDVFDFLEGHPDSYDGIFAANFVEHFDARQVLRLLELCHQALVPQGKMVLATPNPASVITHLHEFWRDATHIRLYNLPLVEFMLTYVGFEIVSSGENDATRSPQAQEFSNALALAKHGQLSNALSHSLESPLYPAQKFQQVTKKFRQISKKFRQISNRDAQLAEAIESLARGLSFLYPAREIYVVARKI